MFSFISIVLLASVLGSQGFNIQQCGDVGFTSREYSTAAFDGSSFYFLGGESSDGKTDDSIFKYNLDGDEPAYQIGVFEDPMSHGTSAIDGNGNIYFFGGERLDDAGYTVLSESIYKLRPCSGWPELLPAELESRRGGIASAIVDNLVYLFGGFGGNFSDNEIEEFNMTSQTSRLVGLLPKYLGHTAAVYNGTYIYLFGGYHNYEVPQKEILRFDPKTYNIEVLNVQLPYELARASATIVNNKALILGGVPDNNNALLFDFADHSIEKLEVEDSIQSLSGSLTYLQSTDKIYSSNGKIYCHNIPK